MYNYAATYSIFDGVSNLYLVSIATAFLAVIIAFYCSNFFKDESENKLNDMLDEVADDYEEEENYSNETTNKIEDYLNPNKMENTSDGETNTSFKNVHARSNSASTNEYSDTDTDEVLIDGLVSKLKSKRVKDLEAQLTRDQLEEEKRIEREQLAAIFELLKKQEAELNMKEINESELNAQLALYR